MNSALKLLTKRIECDCLANKRQKFIHVWCAWLNDGEKDTKFSIHNKFICHLFIVRMCYCVSVSHSSPQEKFIWQKKLFGNGICTFMQPLSQKVNVKEKGASFSVYSLIRAEKRKKDDLYFIDGFCPYIPENRNAAKTTNLPFLPEAAAVGAIWMCRKFISFSYFG